MNDEGYWWMVTIGQLCKELNNYFYRERFEGRYVVENGVINLSELESNGSIQINQYFMINGSVFNDGVYQYPTTNLEDETFNGVIRTMAVPKDVRDLLSEINTWITKYSDDKNIDSPYDSESFQGYSYTKGNNNSDGTDNGSWQQHFMNRMNKWRKI